MKTGICPICQKVFKLTKSDKLWRHGYKQEMRIKKWENSFGIIERRFYKLIKKPCVGTGRLAMRIGK